MTQLDTCPDAETLAAWYERGLRPSELARIEAHVSTCDRCQAILATIARTDALPATPARERGWWSWRWIAPVAAGVAAVALWAVVRPAPSPPVQPPAPASSAARVETAPPALPQPPPLADTSPPARQAAPTPPRERRQDASPSIAAAPAPAQSPDKRDAPRANSNEGATAAFAAPSPAAPPPAAAPAATAAARSVQALDAAAPAPDIVSTDPAIRWRIRGATVEHSSDGGATWTTQTTAASAGLVGGASPSPDVCWIVGRGGAVLRTTDGRSWQTIAFPERVDLTGVQAVDAATATVATADARRFTTRDGGATWTPGGLQEF